MTIKASRFEKLLVKVPWKCLNFPLEKNISNVSTFSFHTSVNYTWFQLWMQDIHLYWSILYCIMCLLKNRIWILLPPLDCCAAFQHLNETWKETVKKRRLFICALLNSFFWPKKNNFSHTHYISKCILARQNERLSEGIKHPCFGWSHLFFSGADTF